MIDASDINLEDVKTHSNYVLLQITPRKTQVTTPNGLKLYFTSEYNPGRHAIVKGVVVSVPRKLMYLNGSLDAETQMELKVGDLVFFDYMESVNAFHDINKQVLVKDGHIYLMINYFSIYVALRKTTEKLKDILYKGFPMKVVCLNGNMICAPTFEKHVDGKILSLDQIYRQYRKRVFKVLFTGSLANDPIYFKEKDYFKPGDYVVTERACDLPLEYDDHRSFMGEALVFRIYRKNVLFSYD